MAVRTSAGSTIGLSASLPATHDSTGFAALTYSTVGEVTDIGEFGREYALVTHNPVGTRATQKYKASYNEGTITLSIGLDTDDAGQILMKAAALSDNNYSFKIVTQNTDAYYFLAKVISFKVGVGGVDQITQATATIELVSSSAGAGIVEVLAA